MYKRDREPVCAQGCGQKNRMCMSECVCIPVQAYNNAEYCYVKYMAAKIDVLVVGQCRATLHPVGLALQSRLSCSVDPRKHS